MKMSENKVISKNWSMRWRCGLCKSGVYLVKTVAGDYFECPNCKVLMPSQVEERECFSNGKLKKKAIEIG